MARKPGTVSSGIGCAYTNGTITHNLRRINGLFPIKIIGLSLGWLPGISAIDIMKTIFCTYAAMLALFVPLATKGQFNYEVDNGSVTITSYTGSATSISIPPAINGLRVVSLGAYSFASSQVTSVTIPNSVTNIDEDAFTQCDQLSAIVIPNSVARIAYKAFFSCLSLTNATIPASVTDIEDEVFVGCSQLNAINVDPGNQVYSSVDGVMFYKKEDSLISFPDGRTGSYGMPEGVREIGKFAFLSARIGQVTIPNSVTNIGNFAFYDCNLTSVTIPGSVAYIGDSAFAYCPSLTNVIIAPGVTSIPEYGFGVCTSLNAITIPNTVTQIGDYSFFVCDSLTNVTIPSSVVGLGIYAFASCANLANVYFKGYGPGADFTAFYEDPNPTIYYLPGVSGWGPTYCDRPTALWNATLLAGGAGFGLLSNQFGFFINGKTNLDVTIERCTDLAGADWARLQTIKLTNGHYHFREPLNGPVSSHFYRINFP